MDEATKAILSGLAEGRRARWIKNKTIRFQADESQVEVFHMLWEGWISRFTKEGAVDFLLSAMCEAEVKLREWDHARKSARSRRDGQGRFCQP